MAMRKIALMHRLFGVCEGRTCRECSNFVKGKYHDRTLCKCKVYGMTQSEASDWTGRWQACGAFNRTINRGPVIREVVPDRMQKETENAPLDGQLRMEF